MYGLPPPPSKEVYEGKDGNLEEEEDEIDEEELRQQARRCLRLFNTLLMLFGGGLCGFAYYTGVNSFGGAWFAFAAAGVGAALFFVTLTGLLGALKINVRILMFYFTCLIFCAFAFLILGGLCLILTEQAVNYLQEEWTRVRREQDLDMTEDEAVDKLRMNLRITGGCCIFLFLLLLSVMSSAIRLITPLKAYTLVLQATNISVLPMGVLLIGASLFIADTAASVDAPYAAFGVFVLGVLVIVIASIGCFGATIESRGIIKLFMILIFVQMIGFIVFGILAFAMADKVKETVRDNWDSIRKVLPSTFSGKYDREQFMEFVDVNLKAMGFLSFCNGLLLLTQFIAGRKLRKALKEESEGDPFGPPAIDDPAKMRHPNRMKKLWKQKWTNGSKRSRRIIKCCCVCGCCCVFLVLVIACLVLYFATSCASISDYSEEKSYVLSSPQTTIELKSDYERGVAEIAIAPDASSPPSVEFSKGAFREGFAAKGFPQLTRNNFTAVDSMKAVPKEPTRALGFDISCQVGDFKTVLPPASSFGGNDLSASQNTPVLRFVASAKLAGMSLDMSSYADAMKPRIRRVEAVSDGGPLELVGMLLGVNGAKMTSTNGDVSIEDTDMQCEPTLLGVIEDSGLYASSRFGAISILNSQFTDCDIYGLGDAALVSLDGVTVRSANGGSLVTLIGVRGLIEVESSVVEAMDIKGEEGSVRVRDTQVLDRLQASTIDNNIELEGLRVSLGGSVQLETSTGDVVVELQEFAGLVSINALEIECSGGGVDECSIQSSGGEMQQVNSGKINCKAQGDCSYRGELVVTSLGGKVTVRAAPWRVKEDKK